MKKFLFFTKIIFITIILIFVQQNVKADVGCLYGGRVYQNEPSIWNWSWSNPIEDECFSGASLSTPFAKVNSGSLGGCSVGFGKNGTKVNYNIEFCPIDDYVGYIIFGIAGVGFFLIKNRMSFS